MKYNIYIYIESLTIVMKEWIGEISQFKFLLSISGIKMMLY